jgi:hypothetical protein
MVYAIRSWNDWWLDNDDDDDDSKNPDADTVVHLCRSLPTNAEVTSDDVTSSKCCCSNNNNNKKRRRRRMLLLDIRSDEEYQRRRLLSSHVTTTMNNRCNKNDNCDCKCNHDDVIICRCSGCFMVVVVHIPYHEQVAVMQLMITMGLLLLLLLQDIVVADLYHDCGNQIHWWNMYFWI